MIISPTYAVCLPLYAYPSSFFFLLLLYPPSSWLIIHALLRFLFPCYLLMFVVLFVVILVAGAADYSSHSWSAYYVVTAVVVAVVDWCEKKVLNVDDYHPFGPAPLRKAGPGCRVLVSILPRGHFRTFPSSCHLFLCRSIFAAMCVCVSLLSLVFVCVLSFIRSSFSFLSDLLLASRHRSTPLGVMMYLATYIATFTLYVYMSINLFYNGVASTEVCMQAARLSSYALLSLSLPPPPPRCVF